MSAPPIFILNLARSPDRRAAMAQRLDALKLTHRFVEAVDGKGREPESFPEYDREARIRRFAHDLLPSEIAICLSHLKAMEMAQQMGVDRAAIFEDDVLVDDDLPDILCAIGDLGSGYDLIRLSGLRRRRMVRPQALGEMRLLARPLGPTSGAQAYVVDRAGMAKIAAFTRPIVQQYDVGVDRYWENGLRIFAVQPWPVDWERDVASDQTPHQADPWRTEADAAFRRRRWLRKRRDSVLRRICDQRIRLGLA